VYHVIQALLYHDRCDIQQRIYAATAHHQKDEIRESVPKYVNENENFIKKYTNCFYRRFLL
jgi:hypothetical protein